YYFRTAPYPNWHDNAFDSVVHAMSVMGTGGFSNYDKSAGLPNEATSTHIIAGGLQNTTSEWILAIFMGFAGMNFSLWYVVLFGKKRWSIFKNSELRWYWIVIIGTTLLIAYFLKIHHFYPTIEQTLRYAFFNVTTIISTTGLGNWDFVNWPVEAIGVLFVCFLVGGMVGSTAGGPKVARFIIAYKYLKQQIHNFVYGAEDNTFTVDGTEYNGKKPA
ncbi:MAG: TrkH family potassium uptake protein, partial [Candidatus Doudnabacteria bacterium]|nr:TrkH family potassium uptake protein [Candidatus Doudnabacteria bacterium]